MEIDDARCDEEVDVVAGNDLALLDASRRVGQCELGCQH